MPSNDVLQVVKEKNGTIWVNCYKQPPSYFDKKNNKFVSFENNQTIVKNSNSLLYPNISPKGGIYFSNANGSLFFRNKKLVENSKIRFNNLFVTNEKFYLKSDVSIDNCYINKYSVYNSNHLFLGQITSKNSKNTFSVKVQNNLIFELFKNKISIFTIKNTKPFHFTSEKIEFKESLKWYSFSDSEIAVITNSGKILIYDLVNFKLKNTIITNKEINYYYKDVNGTVWISTLNDGLLKYTISSVKNINPTEKMNTNFLSIHISNQNQLYAGNFQGEILELKNASIIHNLNKGKNTVWVRAVETFKNKIVAVSDLGYSINYSENEFVVSENKQIVSLKTALQLNDSILILGSNTGLFKLNVFFNTFKALKSPRERVLSLSKINSNSFYFTANKGVFKYDMASQRSQLVFANTTLKNDNIQSLTLSKKGDFWINTVKGNLFLIKNGKVQFSSINSDKLPINSTKLLEIDKQLWIASKDGVFIVNISNLPNFSIQKFSKSDGLISNFINDFTYANDSVYLATNSGISVVSKKIKTINSNVLPIIISAKINNISVPIETFFNLEKDQKNIILELAGVDLTGHFNKFQYTINNENWYTIEGNILNLVLKNGENNIEIRVIDENNYISKNTLNVKFNVAIPFYNTLAFQVIVPFLLFGILFFFYNRRKFEKQKIAFTQQLELEKQRNKITADLHDEIGSTLSSLQINSTVANKLMEKDIPSAQKVLVKVESQAKSLAEKIGDIIWSMKPGKDEFMTLSTRIKNYCNEVLGSTNINYSIDIDPEIDCLITDFSARKNILLITKEAINNALKYSNASQINVNIQIEKKTIKLVISDNGIGFPTNEIKGNGLGNMKNRATELNADFTITSIENVGTTIQLQFKVIP